MRCVSFPIHPTFVNLVDKPALSLSSERSLTDAPMSVVQHAQDHAPLIQVAQREDFHTRYSFLIFKQRSIHFRQQIYVEQQDISRHLFSISTIHRPDTCRLDFHERLLLPRNSKAPNVRVVVTNNNLNRLHFTSCCHVKFGIQY